MGLDMYLFKVKKRSDFSDFSLVNFCRSFCYIKDVEDNDLRAYLSKKSYSHRENHQEVLYIEIAYWRKANMIHNWFYTNCANSTQKDYDYLLVKKTQLEELVKVCKEVLTYKDIAIKEKIIGELIEKLPTKSGFFFGSTQYDENYFNDVEHTISLIDNVLETTDFDTETVFYYGNY
jgi:hypothetical protein